MGLSPNRSGRSRELGHGESDVDGIPQWRSSVPTDLEMGLVNKQGCEQQQSKEVTIHMHVGHGGGRNMVGHGATLGGGQWHPWQPRVVCARNDCKHGDGLPQQLVWEEGGVKTELLT